MLILHATLLDARLLLWSETPLPTSATPGRRRSRPRKKPSVVEPLPFDAGPERLIAELGDALPSVPLTTAVPEPVFLWLPTVAGQPIPSSPLIAELPESDESPTLAPWSVPALSVPIQPAMDLLTACMDRETLASGLVVGASLRYWAAALRFAGAVVAREQFLPDLHHAGEKWFARWKPIIAGAESQRFTALARAMPAACRAISHSADAAPARAASEVLADFLGTTSDALVRSSVSTAVTLRPRTRGKKIGPAFDSLHDQWLHALRNGDGSLSGTDAEWTQFAEQVRAWQRPLAVSAAAPFRLCFRLEEPPPNGAGTPAAEANAIWNVRYLLQAQDDPSLLVPAADAWSPHGAAATVLKRSPSPPRELLLAGLGQAAGLSPEIEASLRSAEPPGFTTDTGGAHCFLTQSAAALRQAGFGVLLPSWWTGKGTQQRLSLTPHAKSPKMQGTSGLTLEELVQFDWKVAIGEHLLSLTELEALARLKMPLVQVRGQWVQVSAEEIQAAIDFLKSKEAGQTTVRELMGMALGTTPVAGGVPIKEVEATGWVGDFLAQLQGKASFAEDAPPPGFQGTLRPYQVRGYSWLAFLRRWGLGSCLADDMGLGKTVQTLALIQHDWESSKRRPVLLICPMSVVGNWKKEAERFTPDLPVLIHHGLKRARDAGFVKEASKHALVISSYALLHRDTDLLKKVKWAGLILDEAQNIKNPETKQAQAARALGADYRIALTGTPVENHVGDLWSIWQFLNPGFLGTQAEFRRAFFVPIQVQRDPAASERLKKLTGPFLLRRLKTDKTVIADLPDKLEMKVFCNLTKEQASLYAAVVGELDKSIKGAEGIQRKGLILATLSKLKQVCNHPAHFLGDKSPIPGRSGKLARLTEMLDELLQIGDKALIFTQFTEMGDILRAHLQETFGREVLFLHGGVGQKQRDRLVARFQEEPDGPAVFLLSLKAGGTGLNLTAANHVFHFDRWWNPAVENQATDRAFRIGQRRNVLVHKFLCVGTLEEKIDQMIESKQQVAAQVVGAGEGWLTEMSDNQLKDLMTLRQEALGE